MARLKNQATGVVVQNPAGFQGRDLVLVESGGNKVLLGIKEVKGNRLVFGSEPKWSGGDVTDAMFVAQQWSPTKVNTLDFRIRASYEEGQVRVSESFDQALS